MAQVTLDAETVRILTQFAKDQGFDDVHLMETVAAVDSSVRLIESIEMTEAVDEDLVIPEPAPKPHLVEDGVVMGSVSTGYVGSQKTFELCTLEEWEELTAEEADELFQDCLWQAIDAGY